MKIKIPSLSLVALLSVSAFAANIVQRNSDDTVRVTDNVSSKIKFKPLEFGEWVKEVTNADFVEISSISYDPLSLGSDRYSTWLVIHNQQFGYRTAKCRFQEGLDESRIIVFLNDGYGGSDCTWWDSNGKSVDRYDPFKPGNNLDSQLWFFRF